jgi:hypothetical protein
MDSLTFLGVSVEYFDVFQGPFDTFRSFHLGVTVEFSGGTFQNVLALPGSFHRLRFSAYEVWWSLTHSLHTITFGIDEGTDGDDTDTSLLEDPHHVSKEARKGRIDNGRAHWVYLC